MTEKEYEELRILVENIFDIFQLKNYEEIRRDQLDDVNNLIDEYLTPDFGWNK